MNIEEQKALAVSVLAQLRDKFPDAILAGGAPRDWYFGDSAKDLDFFLPNSPSKEAIEEALGRPVEALGEGYGGRDFQAYSYRIGEQEVQVMSCRHATAEGVVENFPLSASKIWFDGELRTTEDFRLSAESGILIVSDTGHINHTYLTKVFYKRQTQYSYWVLGKTAFFKAYGDKGYAMPNPFLDVEEEELFPHGFF